MAMCLGTRSTSVRCWAKLDLAEAVCLANPQADFDKCGETELSECVRRGRPCFSINDIPMSHFGTAATDVCELFPEIVLCEYAGGQVWSYCLLLSSHLSATADIRNSTHAAESSGIKVHCSIQHGHCTTFAASIWAVYGSSTVVRLPSDPIFTAASWTLEIRPA
jgi:hypothetical protein